METVRLGKTGIVTNKNGFGALPVQRVSDDEAVKILRRAYEGGITYFDSARYYTDSEHKLGLAFEGMRDKDRSCDTGGLLEGAGDVSYKPEDGLY